MKIVLASVSALSLVLASVSAVAQNMPTCRATARTCNDVAGLDRHADDRFTDVPVSQLAAALPACTAADQPSVTDCDATLRRHNRQGRIITVPAPVGGGVLVLDPTPRPPAAPRAPSGRDGTARRGLQELRPIAVTAYNNTLVLDGNIRRVDAASQARDLQLLANQQQLQAQQAGTQEQVYGLGFQVNDLRAETRYRVFTPFRASWQSGGSPVIATAGVGFGFTKYGQGSDWGLDFNVAVNGYANQPLAPGVLPLFNLWSSIGAAYGRGSVQGVFDLQLSLTGRFGDASQGEVTGPTQGDATLGAAIRFETPLRPTSRPDGARFYGTLRGGLGVGFTQAVVTGQQPLHVGLTVAGTAVIGIAL